MTCQELVELVTRYLEGELAADDMRRFEQHIDGCVWCTRYLKQMRTTINTLGRLDVESISPDARNSLLLAFRDWSAGERAT